MKIKIKENINTITPKYIYFQNKNIFSLKVSNNFKFITLPVNIKVINLNPNPTVFFLYYDGTLNGRTSSASYDSIGAAFMPSLYSQDPHYEDPQRLAGWTAGTPFGWITSREIQYAVYELVKQGLTASSKNKVWMNFESPWENYILFNGYTGPTTILDGISQGIASNFYGKLLTGGTGSDGLTFFGLKHYFPGVSFGYYGQPRWPYYMLNSDIWSIEDQTIDQIIDFAANVWVGCTGLSENIDMLMPSVYGRINNWKVTRIHTGQSIKLCKKINEKLVQAGKAPKEIIAFITPFWTTLSTASPYFHESWNLKNKFKYLPPWSIINNEETKYIYGEQLIEQGADGAIIWASIQYRGQQAKGISGFQEEDIPLGTGSSSWRKGPTGLPNHWNTKAALRQVISAQDNFIKGVCMGITANRWWWLAGPSTEIHTPPEWLPLGSNPIIGATTGITGSETVDRILNQAMYDQLSAMKQLLNDSSWKQTSESILKISGIIPEFTEYFPPEEEINLNTESEHSIFYVPPN